MRAIKWNWDVAGVVCDRYLKLFVKLLHKYLLFPVENHPKLFILTFNVP